MRNKIKKKDKKSLNKFRIHSHYVRMKVKLAIICELLGREWVGSESISYVHFVTNSNIASLNKSAWERLRAHWAPTLNTFRLLVLLLAFPLLSRSLCITIGKLQKKSPAMIPSNADRNGTCFSFATA